MKVFGPLVIAALLAWPALAQLPQGGGSAVAVAILQEAATVGDFPVSPPIGTQRLLATGASAGDCETGGGSTPSR